MLKTKFDRWLIECFIYEHHIKVVHLPEKLPSGIKVSQITTKQYHYLLKVKSGKKADVLIEYLTSIGAAYSTQIVEARHWYNPLINHKNKSFSFRVFWWLVLLSSALFLYKYLLLFLKSDFYSELKGHILELLNT